MKKPLFRSGLLALSLMVSAMASEIPVVPPAKAGLSEAKLQEVTRFLERAVAGHKIAGGIVIVSHAGKIGYLQTCGLRNRELSQPMMPDTIFRIYSMSKAITTAAALALYDAGKLSLDDPVSKYIPSFAGLQVAAPEGLRAPRRPLTVRDLMRHTSGFSYGGGPEASKDAYAHLRPLEARNLEQMCERLALVPLAFDPGADWMYGVSTDVLGRVIEVVSGESLDAFLARTIFNPLDMPDTGFWVPEAKRGRFAANYSRADGGLRVIDAPEESKFTRPTTFFSGGGGLVGTARDYLRFLTMIANGGSFNGHRILRARTVKLMTTNQLPASAFPIHFGSEIRRGTGFGFGFNVRTEITDWDPSGHAGEYGWGGAASTHYWVSPADKLIVVTLEQLMPYNWDTEFGVKKIIYDAVIK